MKFLLAGNIVDTEADRYTPEDVCPAMVSEFIKGLGPNEPIEVEITSYGGSVPAGLAIANMLKMASAEGHRTTAHVIGIAASMASAIACGCDELKIDSNAFLMVHNPFTYAVGNADDMRKEADNLDKFREALVALYRTKFDLDDDTIKKMMDDETWVIGSDAETYKLKAEIIPTAEPLKAAAFAGREMPKWMHVPQTITALLAPKAEDKPVEAKAEPTAEAEMVTKAECEKRVSGMQAAMQKQINDLKTNYEARITDFENQLKAKDDELNSVKAELTSTAKDLESAKTDNAELLAKASALETALAEKSATLAKLNASVLTPQIGQSNAAKNWRAAYAAIRRN